MIDLAPYSLEEVEKHLYQTFRVEYDDLPDEFKSAVGRLVHEANEDFDSYWSKTATRQDALDKRLADFNATRAPKYTTSMLAEARVCGLVNSKDAYDYDIWVEYTGLTQKEFDKLPKAIQVQVYERNMRGYAEFRERTRANPTEALETIQATISEALKQFVGHKLTPKLLGMLKHAILNTGLVDSVDGPLKDDQGRDYFHMTVEKDNEVFQLKTWITIS